MAEKEKVCDTPDCEEKAVCADLCGACYSWAYYHKNQGVSANQRYKKRQRRTAARIERHMPDRKPAKQHARARSQESRAHLN